MASPQVKGGALRNRIRERVPIFGVGSQTRDTQGFVHERQVSILTDIMKPGQSRQTAVTHKDKQIKNCAAVSKPAHDFKRRYRQTYSKFSSLPKHIVSGVKPRLRIDAGKTQTRNAPRGPM